MSYKKCFSPCDECRYSYSKNNQKMSECDICEFNHYRKLDYGGRLIELPCAVGDTVYLISSQYSECSKYQERFNDYNCQGCENECDSHKEYFIHVNENMSAEWIVRAMRLNRFGEDVFLTKEEAEAKLSEMECVE